jgi:nucleotide-binding universal stress UspA family protein
MFERIVVPLDGSGFAEVALAPTRELARVFGACIVVVRAVPPHGFPDVIGGDVYQSDLERADEADAYLHATVQRLRDAGYAADLALALAAPGTAIAQTVTLEHADLVVMAAHLRWKVPASTSISTTLDLLVHSQVPLLAWRVVPAEAGEAGAAGAERAERALRESPLLVPLDGTPLAEGALPHAEALASAFGPYVVLVRVVATPDLEVDATRYLKGVKERLEQSGIHAIALVRTGHDPLSGIEAVWREHAGGLIVMASRGRTGPHGTFFGSLAARLIEEVEAPVLVVRPQALQASTPSNLDIATDVESAGDSGMGFTRSDL